MDPLSIQQALVPLRPDQRFEKDLAILVQNPDPNEIADPIRRPVGVTVSKGGGDNYPDTAGRHGDGVDRKTRPATRHLNAGPVSPARQLAPSPSAPPHPFCEGRPLRRIQRDHHAAPRPVGLEIHGYGYG